MKILTMFIVALALVGGGVRAQAPAPAPVDAEQMAAVRELLDAMNYKQVLSQIGSMMTQQMPQMMDQMIDATAGNGKLTPEQRAEATKLMRESMATSSKNMNEMYNDPQIVEGFENIMARSYARNFTTAEIKATAAFYTSPAGRKALTIMPKMMQETMPEMMALIGPRMKAMAEKMTKEVITQIEKKKNAEGAAAAK
jgi:uncharacterized protein